MFLLSQNIVRHSVLANYLYVQSAQFLNLHTYHHQVRTIYKFSLTTRVSKVNFLLYLRESPPHPHNQYALLAISVARTYYVIQAVEHFAILKGFTSICLAKLWAQERTTAAPACFSQILQMQKSQIMYNEYNN